MAPSFEGAPRPAAAAPACLRVFVFYFGEVRGRVWAGFRLLKVVCGFLADVEAVGDSGWLTTTTTGEASGPTASHIDPRIWGEPSPEQ